MWVSRKIEGKNLEQVHEFKVYGEKWFLTRLFIRFGNWRLRKHGAFNKITGHTIYIHVSDDDHRLIADIIPRWLFVFYWWAYHTTSPGQRTLGLYLHMLELDYWSRIKTKHE